MIERIAWSLILATALAFGFALLVRAAESALLAMTFAPSFCDGGGC